MKLNLIIESINSGMYLILSKHYEVTLVITENTINAIFSHNTKEEFNLEFNWDYTDVPEIAFESIQEVIQDEVRDQVIEDLELNHTEDFNYEVLRWLLIIIIIR